MRSVTDEEGTSVSLLTKKFYVLVKFFDNLILIKVSSRESFTGKTCYTNTEETLKVHMAERARIFGGIFNISYQQNS